MSVNFSSPLGDLEDYFLNDYSLLENKAGSGTLWCWGDNNVGQIGQPDLNDRSSPIQTSAGGSNWVQISCGSDGKYAIKTDGTLWGWGNNTNGELGTGNATNRSSPVQTIAGGTNWYRVSGGAGFAAAIKTDGTLWVWGLNNDGQLGVNDTTSRSSPIQTVAGGNNWRSLSCGHAVMGAIKTDGTLWMWGRATEGQLGTNALVHRSSPVQTIAGGTNWKQLSCGKSVFAACGAIKTDGTLWMWGRNTDGQLGINDRLSRSSPVQEMTGGKNWKQISSGSGHTGAVKTDGTLWMWGDGNFYGQLGTNDLNNRSSPVQTIAGGNNWKLVSCGLTTTVALKIDGTVWSWGRNTLGQLGDGTVVNKSSPVQIVTGGTNWKTVSCQEYSVVGLYWNNTGYPSSIS